MLYAPFSTPSNLMRLLVIGQAYSIPIKLKYDCPAPSKFGKDAPLWKTATTNFIQIVSNCAQRIKQLGEGKLVGHPPLVSC